METEPDLGSNGIKWQMNDDFSARERRTKKHDKQNCSWLFYFLSKMSLSAGSLSHMALSSLSLDGKLFHCSFNE